ncbi:MAG: alanine:cation symporter family protein [Muribaculaceae bacterium]|nr:alanine:cation symporter family protein [Muribaculaceae bacterium]
MNDLLIKIADSVCGYPLFIILIGGGFYLFIRSGLISLRRLPEALKELRRKSDGEGQISSAQALASVVAATIGLGNIAGVAIALVIGGPGAIFWMWVSAVVGMATKYHEGALAIMYRGTDSAGNRRGGTMYIIEKGLGSKWRPLAVFFALSGMVGTMCIMNANQLTEAVTTVFTTPEGLDNSQFLGILSAATGFDNAQSFKLLVGIMIAIVVALVVLGGIKRIARVASVLVPFMVGIYFLMVTYIIATNFAHVPDVLSSIFREAFSLEAGLGGLIGVAIVGARRAALVNDAGVGTASIMHGESKNHEPVREGLIAMLGPSIDSGLVCTLTALALLLCGNIPEGGDIKGLEMAINAFDSAIPGGQYLLLLIVLCFGLSSMFSYSFYGRSCASYLFGEKKSQIYTYIFILSMIVFAVIPLKAAVAVCDLFYALMTIPTMIAVIALSGKVRKATRDYFQREKEKKNANK